MTYTFLKKIIANGNYNKEDLMNKIDVFFMANRITQEQYEELMALVNPPVKEETTEEEGTTEAE